MVVELNTGKKADVRYQSVNGEKISGIFNHIGVAIIVLDVQSGSILLFNKKVCVDLNLSYAEINRKHYRDVFTKDFSIFYENLLKDCQDGELHSSVYYWGTELIWEQISAQLFIWQDGREIVLLTITNINEVTSAEYKYERVAYFDAVTGLPNGKKLEEDVNRLVDTETVALIYLQIKGLDNVNNLYGFDSGDKLMIMIRDWLLSSEKKKAQFYRGKYGIIMLGRGVTMDDAVERAKEIRERFSDPWNLIIRDSEYLIYCEPRIGIVYGKYIKDEMRTILVRSLNAPLQPGGYSVYDEKADRQAEFALRLSQFLINSVHNDMKGFSVSYQPIVDVISQRWAGAETLCRWKSPDGTDVPPSTFIRIAEEVGLITKIDNWVRNTAMEECMKMGLDKKEFFLDVNLSPMHNIDHKFIDDLINNIERTGYPPEKLVMEITESEKLEFNEQNINGLKKLNEKNIIFSLDDFGTGYSSFDNLINIPASTLKTEKMFLDDIEKSEYKQYLLKIIIGLAHRLNMQIICEGVETEGQRRLLRKYKANYAQGYLFSKPLCQKKFEKEIWRYR